MKLSKKLILEWNNEKNGDLKPEDVTANSDKIVWWKCIDGHEWKAKIFSRTNGANCPYCVRVLETKDRSNLATMNSNLAREWNVEKNGDLKPEDVTENSEKKFWWKCKDGHEGEATVE